MSAIRINAFLASAGLGSRRSVEDLITRGKIQVNGEFIHELSFRVDPEKDEVIYKGRKLTSQSFRYIMLNKPPGYMCTRQDPHAVRTVYDLLPRDLHHLSHVGRLDADSEGLLLLTNDGNWTNKILHPRNQIGKVYEVEVLGRPNEADMAKAVRGIRHKGEMLKIESSRCFKETDKSSSWELVLNQGKKREIRRIFEVLEYRVINLKRVAIGKLKIGPLKHGQWRDLTSVERKMLLS